MLKKIIFWLSRIPKIPSYLRRFGLGMACRRTVELIRSPKIRGLDTRCLNPVYCLSRYRAVKRANARHAFIEQDVLRALKTGELKRLEKFGVIAEKGALPDAECREQEDRSRTWQTTFSLLVPLYNTPPRFLAELVFSVLEQTYPHWELCLVDASDASHGEVEKVVSFFAAQDTRIRYRRLEKNDGISGNTNAAIEMAHGDYIVLLDHDDLLHPAALYHVAEAIARTHADFVYTDECVFYDDRGDTQKCSNYKPDFSPDYLRGCNYICHLSAFSRVLLEKAGGGFRHEYDGSQDHDLILRLTEKATRIEHVPKCLYFWRAHAASVASGVAAKPYAITAGIAAVQASIDRLGLKGKVGNILNGPVYRICYEIVRPGKVSIVIPTRNHAKDLRRCIESIREKTTSKDYEIVVVDNGSDEADAKALLAELATVSGIKIVPYDVPFNFSAICNVGASHATGEYLLFLNNDTEVISPGWLEEMMMFAQRPDVGVVGAKLYYENNTVQHAAIVLNRHYTAKHAFVGEPRMSGGYASRAILAGNFSAVTGACMMMRAELFRKIGGFDETFPVAYNDIDLCLRVRDLGLLVVMTPFAELYHYESRSRGYEDTEEKKSRLKAEGERIRARWKDVFQSGDPYYNPNFSSDTLFEEAVRP